MVVVTIGVDISYIAGQAMTAANDNWCVLRNEAQIGPIKPRIRRPKTLAPIGFDLEIRTCYLDQCRRCARPICRCDRRGFCEPTTTVSDTSRPAAAPEQELAITATASGRLLCAGPQRTTSNIERLERCSNYPGTPEPQLLRTPLAGSTPPLRVLLV
jgi:hypothetical protein